MIINLLVLQPVFKNLKLKVLYLRIKKLKQFLKLIYFIVNNNNTYLLDNIVNKNYIYSDNSKKRITLREIILQY